MTHTEQAHDHFEADPDCGVNAAADRGYWLEEAGIEISDQLIRWRKRAGMSPEILSRLAPIPLEEYFQIERGERAMTSGDAWRIDAAIMAYRHANETWFQKTWRKNRLWKYKYKLNKI